MVASKVEIVNLALDALGHTSIADFDDITNPVPAGLARRSYDTLRDALLREFPWKFASCRTTATATAETPSHGYDNAYAVDPDCLRVLSVLGESYQKWTREGALILTNIESPIYYRFIKRITQVGLYDPMFVTCLAARLGRDWAPKLTSEPAKKKELGAAYDDAIRIAFTTDSIEREEHDTIECYDWIIARRGGGAEAYRWAKE